MKGLVHAPQQTRPASDESAVESDMKATEWREVVRDAPPALAAKRITVQLVGESAEALEELSKSGKALSEIIRDAVWLEREVRRAIEGGGSFILRDARGREREYMLR